MSKNAISGERYADKVGAAFPDHTAAAEAAEDLRDAGLGAKQIKIISPDDSRLARKLQPESRGIARTLGQAHVVFGLAGFIVGLAAALIAIWTGVPVISANAAFSVFAFLLVGTLVGLMLGGLFALRPDQNLLWHQAISAMNAGEWMVVIHARDNREREQATAVLRRRAP